MIEYINKRMIDWATWLKRREDGGIGYPGAANFSKLVSTHAAAGPGLIVEDAAAMEIERIVGKIKKDRPQRYEVAYWIYLAGDLTMERVARELRCHRDTVYTRLHALHQDVMDELHEITIQAADLKRNNREIVVLQKYF